MRCARASRDRAPDRNSRSPDDSRPPNRSGDRRPPSACRAAAPPPALTHPPPPATNRRHRERTRPTVAPGTMSCTSFDASASTSASVDRARRQPRQADERQHVVGRGLRRRLPQATSERRVARSADAVEHVRVLRRVRRRRPAAMSRWMAMNVSTTCGSYILPRRARRMSSAASSVIAGRYGRSDVSASKQSTTERIRAPIGMSAPESAARIAAAVPALVMAAHDRARPGYGKSTSDRMSAPTSTCSFICSNSDAVSPPGLLRMCSGTASLPVSCSSAAALIALIDSSSVMPSAFASAERVRLHAPHVAVRHVVFRVDRHRERFDRSTGTAGPCSGDGGPRLPDRPYDARSVR